MAKSAEPIATNDEVRGNILKELHEVHRKSRSPKSAAILLQKLAAKLKNDFDYKQQQVASNLDYLVQKGWVAAVREQRKWTSPTGTQQDAERITYKISAIGIDKLEDGSLYKAPPLESRMNITNINGVTIVGDGNVVNTHFANAAKALKELRDAVATDISTSPDIRLSAISDIDSISTQLQKPTPSAEVIRTLWKGIEAAVVTGHAVELLHKAAHFLHPLLS